MNVQPDQSRVICTDRLLLRPHELTDFEQVYALWADPVVIRHIFDRPQTEAEAWFRLLRYAGHWQFLGYGYWAVLDRADGTFLGEVGFADYRREIEPPFDGTPEAGWVMAAHSHGRGFAKEAVAAALAWADQNIPADSTVAMITPENTASLRLSEKLGYRRQRISRYRGEERVVSERPRCA